jgi:hypothetical protein
MSSQDTACDCYAMINEYYRALIGCTPGYSVEYFVKSQRRNRLAFPADTNSELSHVPRDNRERTNPAN